MGDARSSDPPSPRARLASAWRSASRLGRGVGPGAGRAALLYALIPALTIVNAGVGLVVPLLLGPAKFGQYAIAVTLFQYGLIFDFGASQLIDRRIPVLLAAGEQDEVAHFTSDVLWFRLYIAMGVMTCGTALLLLVSAAGALPFGAAAGVLSMTAGLLFMIALGPAAIYRATSQRRAFALVNISCSVVLAAARPAGIVAGGIVGCFGALAACYALLAFKLQAAMPLQLSARPSATRAWSLLRLGLPLFITSFTWAFYMTANRWVVSFQAPAVELGHFAFGANIVYLAVGSVGALSQFYYPRVTSRFAAEGDFSVSRTVLRDFSVLALAVAIPSAVGILAGPALIDMFYPKFSGSEAVLGHLLVAVPSLVVASWLMPLSLSTGTRPWVEGVLVYPVALGLLMSLTYLGYRFDGIGGASKGLFVSALPLLGLQLCVARKSRLMRGRDAALLLLAAAGATALLGALAF